MQDVSDPDDVRTCRIGSFTDGALAAIRIGTAAWCIPKEHAAAFPVTGSHLERYGAVLNAVEINSSFYRPHRAATYERWAASVPDHFRFAVKIPKAITHEHRLQDVGDLLARGARREAATTTARAEEGDDRDEEDVTHGHRHRRAGQRAQVPRATTRVTAIATGGTGA